MNLSETEKLVKKQKEYFNSGFTRDIAFRRNALSVLKKAIIENESGIFEALKQDLNKAPFETYATEIGIVLDEINFMLKNMKRLLKSKRVRTPIVQFPSVSRIYREPYGCVLIISPWNYPFQLTLTPLVGAIAGGNCVILKPSNYSGATSSLINKLISQSFNDAYIAAIEGGRETNQHLLDNKFDLIFFTGSSKVGRIVMEKAAANLTPVILELGGKSPCIVDKSADIRLAAKRIAWGKMLNSGQTCIAPDYLLVHKDVKELLIEELKKNIEKFFGEHPEKNQEYPKIINDKHFNRLCNLIKSGDILYGGGMNEETNQISLTVLDHAGWDDPSMQDELFGPILPVIEYMNLDDIISKINNRPNPLALYLFTKSKKTEQKIINEISYGGGCINDTVVHLANPHMGFGGTGESGMGSYHGAASIRAFTHSKSILKKSNIMDIPIRYAPYKNRLKLLKKLM